MRLTLLVLAGALYALPVQAAEYYKWVDQNGVVQYSLTPPKDQQAQTVKADSKPARADPADAAAAATASDPQNSIEQAQAVLREHSCASATTNLRALNRSKERVITRKDPESGKHVPLTAAEIENERKIAEQLIAENCEQG